MDTEMIVMRLADMRRVHPQQDNSRVCSKCGEQVGIYPSGQFALRADPSIVLICNRCRTDDPMVRVSVLAPGAELEPFESIPAPKK